MSTLLPWIDAVGWTLLHFLWQGVLIGIAWAAARGLLAREASGARYRLGLGALALLASTPLLTLARLWPAATTPDAAAAITDAATALAAPTVSAGDAAIQALLPWLVALWLAGVGVLALRALREWHRLDRIVRRMASAHAHIDAMLDAVKTRCGFAHRVRALVTAQVDTPMLIGWLRPVILLPAAVALGFPRQQVELILAHELGHLQRHDHLVNLLQTALETVLFYHPVVHWISRDVRNERELCCDRLVLRALDGRSHEYARTLAALEELRLATPMMPAATGGELLVRVQRIVGVPAAHSTIERRSSGRWLLPAIALLALWIGVAQRPVERLVASMPGSDWVELRMSAPAYRDLALPRWQAPRVAVDAVAEPAVSAPSVVASSAAAAATRSIAAMPAPTAAATVASTVAANPLPAPAPSLAPAPADAPLPAAAPPKPRIVRSVAPAYPGSVIAARIEVEASFAIAADGSVRDVRVQGRADRSFRRAVEQALRQWRFDPATLGADSAARYVQTFVFAPPAELASDDGCQRQTGSMLCRPTVESAAGTSAGGS